MTRNALCAGTVHLHRWKSTHPPRDGIRRQCNAQRTPSGSGRTRRGRLVSAELVHLVGRLWTDVKYTCNGEYGQDDGAFTCTTAAVSRTTQHWGGVWPHLAATTTRPAGFRLRAKAAKGRDRSAAATSTKSRRPSDPRTAAAAVTAQIKSIPSRAENEIVLSRAVDKRVITARYRRLRPYQMVRPDRGVFRLGLVVVPKLYSKRKPESWRWIWSYDPVARPSERLSREYRRARSRVVCPKVVFRWVTVWFFSVKNSSQGLFTGAARSAKGGDGDNRLEKVYAKKESLLLDTNNVIGKTADTSVQNYIEVDDKVRILPGVFHVNRDRNAYDSRCRGIDWRPTYISPFFHKICLAKTRFWHVVTIRSWTLV